MLDLFNSGKLIDNLEPKGTWNIERIGDYQRFNNITCLDYDPVQQLLVMGTEESVIEVIGLAKGKDGKKFQKTATQLQMIKENIIIDQIIVPPNTGKAIAIYNDENNQYIGIFSLEKRRIEGTIQMKDNIRCEVMSMLPDKSSKFILMGCTDGNLYCFNYEEAFILDKSFKIDNQMKANTPKWIKTSGHHAYIAIGLEDGSLAIVNEKLESVFVLPGEGHIAFAWSNEKQNWFYIGNEKGELYKYEFTSKSLFSVSQKDKILNINSKAIKTLESFDDGKFLIGYEDLNVSEQSHAIDGLIEVEVDKEGIKTKKLLTKTIDHILLLPNELYDSSMPLEAAVLYDNGKCEQLDLERVDSIEQWKMTPKKVTKTTFIPKGTRNAFKQKIKDPLGGKYPTLKFKDQISDIIATEHKEENRIQFWALNKKVARLEFLFGWTTQGKLIDYALWSIDTIVALTNESTTYKLTFLHMSKGNFKAIHLKHLGEQDNVPMTCFLCIPNINAIFIGTEQGYIKMYSLDTVLLTETDSKQELEPQYVRKPTDAPIRHLDCIFHKDQIVIEITTDNEVKSFSLDGSNSKLMSTSKYLLNPILNVKIAGSRDSLSFQHDITQTPPLFIPKKDKPVDLLFTSTQDQMSSISKCVNETQQLYGHSKYVAFKIIRQIPDISFVSDTLKIEFISMNDENIITIDLQPNTENKLVITQLLCSENGNEKLTCELSLESASNITTFYVVHQIGSQFKLLNEKYETVHTCKYTLKEGYHHVTTPIDEILVSSETILTTITPNLRECIKSLSILKTDSQPTQLGHYRNPEIRIHHSNDIFKDTVGCVCLTETHLMVYTMDKKLTYKKDTKKELKKATFIGGCVGIIHNKLCVITMDSSRILRVFGFNNNTLPLLYMKTIHGAPIDQLFVEVTDDNRILLVGNDFIQDFVVMNDDDHLIIEKPTLMTKISTPSTPSKRGNGLFGFLKRSSLPQASNMEDQITIYGNDGYQEATSVNVEEEQGRDQAFVYKRFDSVLDKYNTSYHQQHLYGKLPSKVSSGVSSKFAGALSNTAHEAAYCLELAKERGEAIDKLDNAVADLAIAAESFADKAAKLKNQRRFFFF